MGDFEKPIRGVQLRLGFQHFLTSLVWCLTASLSVLALAISFERLGLQGLPAQRWVPLVVAIGTAFLFALVVAWLRVPNPVDAAVALDHQFGLHERVSTALSLPSELRQTPVGQAVFHDAIRSVQNLDLGSRFRLKRPRFFWLPVLPALVAVGVMLIPDAVLPLGTSQGATARPPGVETKKAVDQALKAVAQNLAKQRESKQLEASASEKVLAELQKAVEDMSTKPAADKQQTLVALNKLADSVQERRKQMASTEQMSRQLQQLKEMAGGPAEDFASDLAKGDFSKAAEDLKKLQEKLASGALSEQEKKELSKQLGDIQKQLDKMAGLEERKKQLEEARKKGLISEQQYQEQKQKIDDQAKGMKSLQNLAQKLSDAQSQMASGDPQKAAEALKQAESELRDMASKSSELESLDAAMADLQEAKDSMNGDDRGQPGDGKNSLGQALEGMSGLDGMGNRPGQGMGRGRGQGDRAEAPDKTAGYDSKVKQQITKGKAVLGGFADPSKQIRGESVLEIQGNVEAAAISASEALTDQKIPKNFKKHVQSYFDQVRTGE